MREGIVLSIDRCSLHDGPGIRTTVFLKGCPLRCAWCHNPESQSPDPQLQYMHDKCTCCGACENVCPNGVHSVDAAQSLHAVDRSRCTLCGKCVEACPAGALRIAGSTMGVDEVMAEVEKDQAYYDESGGGITISGGEPLFQFDYAMALLEECRKRGIHTCIETSGFAAIERFRLIAPFVDLFLFDYKATGDPLHRELTGVGQVGILSALDLLDRLGKAVVLRCPLVPGVNDTPAHLRAIAGLSQKHRNIRAVELMAYHDYARDKYRRIGQEYGLTGVKTPDEEVAAEWVAAVKVLGCCEVRIG